MHRTMAGRAREVQQGRVASGAWVAKMRPMLRSILLALDDTPGAQAARDLAFDLARAHGAELTAALVLDRPHTRDDAEPVPIGGAAFAARRNEALARAVEEEAARVLTECERAAAGFAFRVERLEEAPEPALLAAGAAHDLIVIGRDSTLGREACDDGLAPAVEALLRDGARPLLVVPPAGGPAPRPDAPVLALWEGDLPDQRTLQLFALLGLGQGRLVRLLSFAGEGPTAAMAAYLRAHGLAVEAASVEGDGEAVLLAEARSLHAWLMVLGADEEGGIARLVFGSRTAALLRGAPCPVFIHG